MPLSMNAFLTQELRSINSVSARQRLGRPQIGGIDIEFVMNMLSNTYKSRLYEHRIKVNHCDVIL